MKHVQSLTRKIGPVISQTGACLPPPPVALTRLGQGLGTLLCLVAVGWSLDFQVCPLARPRGRLALAGLRRAGRCLGGIPAGAQQKPSQPSGGGCRGFLLPALLVRAHADSL